MRKYSWIAIAVLIVDQATKLAARGLGEKTVTLIPGVLGLQYAENTGMAFSMLSGMPWLLGILSAFLVIAAILAMRRFQPRGIAMPAAMLMLGGAAGNMIDRLIHGYVIDMIDILLFRFAIFNIADTALTVGCGLMAFSLLFRPGDWSEKKHGDTEGNAV